MPNTLCHIGVQGPLSRFASRGVDLRLVILGCIIPDLPWILLTLLLQTQWFNPYDLRLYCTAQASLFFCLFFCLGVASLSSSLARVFTILFTNSLIHLLLDAIQIKWGNGINLIAPFNWKLQHLDLTWPEHSVTLALTVTGCIYLCLKWKEIVNHPLQLELPPPRRLFMALFFLICYTIGPLFVLSDLEMADTYYLHTMRQVNERPGKAIEFDRVHYFAETRELRTFSGERLTVSGAVPEHSGRVSFKGRFLTPSTFLASRYHLHKDFRDIASYIGLFMACTLLVHSLILTLSWSHNNSKGCP